MNQATGKRPQAIEKSNSRTPLAANEHESTRIGHRQESRISGNINANKSLFENNGEDSRRMPSSPNC